LTSGQDEALKAYYIARSTSFLPATYPFSPIATTDNLNKMFEGESASQVRSVHETLTAGLRTSIDAHFGSSPLVKQRAEFMTVSSATPLDRKVKFTPEVVGAAAAYESWKAFERDPAHKPTAGGKLAHAKAKIVCPPSMSTLLYDILTGDVDRRRLGCVHGYQDD